MADASRSSEGTGRLGGESSPHPMPQSQEHLCAWPEMPHNLEFSSALPSGPKMSWNPYNCLSHLPNMCQRDLPFSRVCDGHQGDAGTKAKARPSRPPGADAVSAFAPSPAGPVLRTRGDPLSQVCE